MNTDSYRSSATTMPPECAGMFFIPEHSSKNGFSGMPAYTPQRLVLCGFGRRVKNSTFHHIPLAVECQKKNMSQQSRGLQRCQVFNIPDIPHMQPVAPPHSFFEQCHGHPLPA